MAMTVYLWCDGVFSGPFELIVAEHTLAFIPFNDRPAYTFAIKDKISDYAYLVNNDAIIVAVPFPADFTMTDVKIFGDKVRSDIETFESDEEIEEKVVETLRKLKSDLSLTLSEIDFMNANGFSLGV